MGMGFILTEMMKQTNRKSAMTKESDQITKTASADTLIETLKSEDVEFSQLEFSDIHGILRGKIAGVQGISKGSTASGGLMSTIGNDEIVPTPFVRLEYGTEKYSLVPDLATAKKLAWRPDTAAVICEFHELNGAPLWADPRIILRRAQEKLSGMGYQTMVGLEVEFFLYENDDELLRNADHKKLKSRGRDRHAYSLGRLPLVEAFAKEFIRRMKCVGVEVEAFHTEYAIGMYEFAFAPLTAIEAADAWVRAKAYLKELAHEYGLVTSFMPVLAFNEIDTCTGVHQNVSLWENGENAFWDSQNNTLSKVGEQFGAGLMAGMQDSHLLFRPFVNSYRRFNPEGFNPVHVAWGLDNHFASLRLAHGAAPEKQTRWEHRIAGSDVCLYLTLASILLSGAYGVEHELDLSASIDGKMPDEWDADLLSSTLSEATENFKNSQLMKELFGEQFTEHYSLLKHFEWEAFEAWSKESGGDAEHNSRNVTPWEFSQYFDWI